MAREPVYSSAFFAEPGFSGSATYTVSLGFVAVIRDVDVCWIFGLTGAEFQLKGNAGQVIWLANFPILGDDQDQWQGWRGRHVVAPGDSFTIESDSAVDVSVSGYLLGAT